MYNIIKLHLGTKIRIPIHKLLRYGRNYILIRPSHPTVKMIKHSDLFDTLYERLSRPTSFLQSRSRIFLYTPIYTRIHRFGSWERGFIISQLYGWSFLPTVRLKCAFIYRGKSQHAIRARSEMEKKLSEPPLEIAKSRQYASVGAAGRVESGTTSSRCRR